MVPRLAVLLAAIVILVMPGCGKWPPIVANKADVERLPETQTSVRARGLPDSDIPALARLRQLRALDFSGGNAVKAAPITDQGLAELAKLDLPFLDTLTLGWCDNITDAGLNHIGRMQTINFLGLPSCPKITDAGLPELINAKNLTGLDLRGNPNLTDDGIQQLAANANWKDIDLGGCPKLTAQGVAKLQAALPKGRVLKGDKEWDEHFARVPRPWRKQ